LDISYSAHKLYISTLKRKHIAEYNRISELYKENITRFSEPEQLKLYIILQNIRIRFIEERKTAWKIAFNVTKVALSNKVLGKNNSFNHFTFTSITTLGAAIGEFNYTESFIQDYHPLLTDTIREDIKNYSLAYLAFFRGKYEDVDFLISQVNFTNISGLRLNAKSLVIRSYYELLSRDGREWLSLLRSHLRSFDKYLNRTKSIRPGLKQAYQNFVAITKKLTVRQINAKTTIEQQKELQLLLANSSPIVLKPWIAKKIDNLLKRKVGQKNTSSTR